MTNAVSGAAAAAVSPEDYAFLQTYLQDVSGLSLGPDKLYFLEARLLPVAAQQNLDSLSALCTALRRGADRKLQKSVIEAVTTHETLFFRDSTTFHLIERRLLPEIIQRNQASRTIRLWSAAASSGQEAYSMVMLMHELGLADWNIEVLGTDISEPILESARQGRYRQMEVNRGLPAKYLVKYFKNEGREWQVSDAIRARVRFEKLDLRSSFAGKGPFDLVLCRNVLIYFDAVSRAGVLRRLAGTLKPRCCFLLGSTEVVLENNLGFAREVHEGVTYYRI